jgi:hypothetical protein
VYQALSYLLSGVKRIVCQALNYYQAYVSRRVSIRQCCSVPRRTKEQARLTARQHTPATSACVSIRQHTSAYGSIRQHTSVYVSIRQHTSAYVSIRQHTSAYVTHSIPHSPTAYVSIPHSIRQHTSRTAYPTAPSPTRSPRPAPRLLCLPLLSAPSASVFVLLYQ